MTVAGERPSRPAICRSRGPRTRGNGAPGRPPGDARELDPFPRLTPCASHHVTLPRSIGLSVEVGRKCRRLGWTAYLPRIGKPELTLQHESRSPTRAPAASKLAAQARGTRGTPPARHRAAPARGNSAAAARILVVRRRVRRQAPASRVRLDLRGQGSDGSRSARLGRIQVRPHWTLVRLARKGR